MTGMPSIEIRPEQLGNAGAVGRLLDAAFSGPLEASLVDKLRAGGEVVLALVAISADVIVGYAAWPRLWVDAGPAAARAVGLAPLAVTSALQRRGIGSALVRASLARTRLARLKERNESLVFVLGDPVYYGRFGFSRDAARGYESIYAGDHFMAQKLDADAPDRGVVRYPAAFNALT